MVFGGSWRFLIGFLKLMEVFLVDFEEGWDEEGGELILIDIVVIEFFFGGFGDVDRDFFLIFSFVFFYKIIDMWYIYIYI